MERAVIECDEMGIAWIAPRVPKSRTALSAGPVVGFVRIASETAVDQVVRRILTALAARLEVVDSHLARGVGFCHPAESQAKSARLRISSRISEGIVMLDETHSAEPTDDADP